jgi:hypothetical protein
MKSRISPHTSVVNERLAALGMGIRLPTDADGFVFVGVNVLLIAALLLAATCFIGKLRLKRRSRRVKELEEELEEKESLVDDLSYKLEKEYEEKRMRLRGLPADFGDYRERLALLAEMLGVNVTQFPKEILRLKEEAASVKSSEDRHTIESLECMLGIDENGEKDGEPTTVEEEVVCLLEKAESIETIGRMVGADGESLGRAIMELKTELSATKAENTFLREQLEEEEEEEDEDEE